MQPSKSRSTAILLCLFLGGFGAHRFYTGKIGTAITQLLLTISIVGVIISGIWVFVDFIILIVGSFTDKNGQRLV